MENFKEYKRKGLSEMRPFKSGEIIDIRKVSISPEDLKNGSPRVGDMIARNPLNHDDKWLVAEKYFNENLELAVSDSCSGGDVSFNGTREEWDALVLKNNSNLDFGAAIKAIKAGRMVARAGWNGSDMFVYYVKANSYATQSDAAFRAFPEGVVPYRAYMALKTAQGDVATWSPSGSDALAEDWIILSK
jgi:hypothetical protein